MIRRMQTRVIEVDPLEDCRSVYKEAATVMTEGGLVASPTETVYGLGADALNTEAVANVFAVKARPSFDPLICHFARAKDIADYTEVPAELQPLVDKLAKEFWLGFVRIAEATMHIRKMAGTNSHHIIEGAFKSIARSMRAAVSIDEAFADDILSTKGVL